MTEHKAWQHPIKTVGVIGLSGVGRPVCRRIAEAGHKVGVTKIACFDTDKATKPDPDSKDVVVCKSVVHLADMADLILLCLPEAGDVGKIVRSHDGVLDCVRKDQIIVDHGWSSLELTRQLATAFAGRGATYLDAPIGRRGNVDRVVEAGRLALAIGGETAAIDAVSPLLGCFAGSITRVGPVGTAQVVRHMGDLIALQTFAALAEALVTGHAFGVEGDRMLDALAKENGDGAGLGRQALAQFLGDDEPAAATERTSISDAERRLKEVIQLAAGKNLNLEGADSTLGLLEKAIEKGLGEQDLSGLFRVMEPEPKTRQQGGRNRS